MQTIKTAAIVVLMLTVLYGGYVSLTTPPDPIPEQIQDLIVVEEHNGPMEFQGDLLGSDLQLSEPPASLGSDPAPAEISLTAPSGDSLSLGAPSNSLGAPSNSLAAPANSSLPDLSDPSFSDSADARGSSGKGTGTYGASFAELPPIGTRTATAPTKLPPIGNAAPRITPQAYDAYQSTAKQFALPDPNQAANSFQTPSQPFVGAPGKLASSVAPTGFKLSDQPSLSSPGNSQQSPVSGTALSDLQPPAQENRGLSNAFATADQLYAKGQLKEALATLSVFYGMPGISEQQNQALLGRLDPLARDVIYSKRHLLDQPYRINASETLAQVAKRFDVPWQLLANINRVDDPVTILPGTELKVVRGPFRAEVDLTRQELTLFLGDLYAGRFQVAIGNDPPPAPGSFTVQEKQTSHVYYDRSGVPVPAGSPENPYGNMWLDLGGQLCIHGSPNTVRPTEQGCISLAADYADDLYGILSQGSSVTIRR